MKILKKQKHIHALELPSLMKRLAQSAAVLTASRPSATRSTTPHTNSLSISSTSLGCVQSWHLESELYLKILNLIIGTKKNSYRASKNHAWHGMFEIGFQHAWLHHMSKAKMHFLAVLPPNLIMASINTGPAGESKAQLSTWLSCFNHARFFQFCLHSCIMTDCAGSTFLNHGTSST